jgi:hypothetical protein
MAAEKAKKSAQQLKDEQAMKDNYELMLQLGMVEFVRDLELIKVPAAKPEKKEEAKK